MDSDLQNTRQSHSFDENLKWSHGHYAHFSPDDFIQNHNKSWVLDKSVGLQFFKSLGLTTNAHLIVVFSEAYMGCTLFWKCWLSSFFSMGVVVWGSCCRRFFRGGRSVIVRFALSSPLYSWTQIPVVTGVMLPPEWRPAALPPLYGCRLCGTHTVMNLLIWCTQLYQPCHSPLNPSPLLRISFLLSVLG